MPKQDQKTYSQVKEQKAERLPYEPPRLEIVSFRPEEQLLACGQRSQHHCGSATRKLS